MKNKIGKIGYYIGAGIGALISAWSIFKVVTSNNSCECEEDPCDSCEEPCEECTDESAE